eukprot:gene11060-12893_t
MNELQKKLARRRSLNGEQIASIEAEGGAEVCVAPPPRETKNGHRQDIAASADGNKNLKASELQSKLARRRDLNGEDAASAAAAAAVVKESTTSAVLENARVSVPTTEQTKPTDLEQSQSRTTSLTDADGPAWLNDFASTVQTMEPFRAQSTEEFSEANDEASEPITHEDNVLAHLNQAEASTDDVGVTNSVLTSEENGPQEEQVVGAQATESVETLEDISAVEQRKEQSEDGEKEILIKAVSSDDAAPVEDDTFSAAPANESATEVSDHTDRTVPVERQSAPADSVELKTSETMAPMEEALQDGDLMEGASQSSDAVLPVEDSPPIAGKAPIQVDDKMAVDTTVNKAIELKKPDHTETPAVAEDPVPAAVKAPAAPVPLTAVAVPPVQSPQRSRGGWSPLRATATQPAQVLPTVDTGSANNAAAYPRSNTSTGTPQGQQGGGLSPLRRSTSFTGATTPNPRTPGRKTSWYPGKFLIEGPAGWSSKNATPMIKMNPDQARSHYADLMSSSATDAVTSASEGKKTSPKSTMKVKVNQKEQREEEARATKISDSMATGTSDEIIDMVLELGRENVQLKKEVARLKAQLSRQNELLAAYERGEAPPLSSAMASTATDDSLGDADVVDSAVAESLKHQHYEEAELIAARATSFSSNDSHNSSRTSVSETDPMPERAVRPTSNTLSSPTASSINAGIASGNASANGSAVKTRASRRFGARAYYSAYQSEESEDGLFGSEEAVEEIGQNNKYQTLTFEDQYDGLNETSKPAAASTEASVDMSLDKLLRSGTLSSSRDSVNRGLVNEKHLVQSFRSTSAVTSKAGDTDGVGAEAKRNGDWQQRFGHLGLIAPSDEKNGAPTEEKQDKQQLFNEEADAKARVRTAANEAREATMEYEEFISKFTRTTELVDMTREFMSSVVGPNGDATPPVGRKKLSYVFYGTHKLDVRCRQFFDQVQELFLTWPEFKDETDERLICARDGIEQYIMQRIAEFAFKSTVDAEGDELLSKRMKLLSFLKPEALDIKPDLFNETLLTIAANELRKINGCKTPGDKVACVVKSASVIFRSLSLSRAKSDSEQASSNGTSSSANQDDTNIAGADDFLPLFIWVVMRSHIPRLCSNVNYVQTYLNPARLMGKWGYCLINLSSAIEFVKYIEADQLVIDPKEFEGKLIEAERELNGGFL